MNRSFLSALGVAAIVLLIGGHQETSAQQTESDAGAYDPEARLEELGIMLPDAPSPVANYVNGVRTGNLIFLAGKGPRRRT